MGKKNKALRNVASENKDAVQLAQKNAQILAEAFQKTGISVRVITYDPAWCSEYKNKRPKTVTAVILNDIADGDGFEYEFNFSHDTGLCII